MAHHPEEMLKHIKIYLVIFLALAVLTGVTVWASNLQVSHHMHIIIALSIASVKAGLVAAFFMHLISEKTLIRSILVITMFLFLVVILLTYFVETTRGPLLPHLW